jgi:hypothetical protein
MQKARRHPIKGLRPLVSAWFQVLLTSLFEILFTFPSRYWFTIGLSVVFSLTGWCRQVPTRLHQPRGTQDTASIYALFEYGSFTLYGLTFQKVLLQSIYIIAVLQPHICRNKCGLGYFPFARHYLGNHYCFLFLRLLRCFSSAGYRLSTSVKTEGLPHSEIHE